MLVTLSQIVQRFIQSLRPSSLVGVVNQLSSLKDRISNFIFSRPPSVSPPISIIPSADGSSQIIKGVVSTGEESTLYYVEYGTTPTFGFTTPLYSSSVVEGVAIYEIQLQGLQSDQKYFYRVRAYNGFNDSLEFNSVDITSGSFFITEPLKPEVSILNIFDEPVPLDPYEVAGDPVQLVNVPFEIKVAESLALSNFKVYISKQQDPTCDPPSGEEIQITFSEPIDNFCSVNDQITFSSAYFTSPGQYYWILFENQSRIILTLENNLAKFQGPCLPCTPNLPVGPRPTSTQLTAFHKGSDLSFQTEVPYIGWYNGLSKESSNIGEEPFGNISLNYYSEVGEWVPSKVVQATKARMDAEQAIFPNRKFIIDIPIGQMFAFDKNTKQTRDQVTSHVGGFHDGSLTGYPPSGWYTYSGSREKENVDVPLNNSLFYTSPNGCVPPYDNCDTSFIGTLVNGLKDDDRIIAWYIADEPEAYGYRGCQPIYTAEQCKEMFDQQTQFYLNQGDTQATAEEKARNEVYLNLPKTDKYCFLCTNDKGETTVPVTADQTYSYSFLMDRYNYVKSLDSRPVIAVIGFKGLFGLYDKYSGRNYPDPYTKSAENPDGILDDSFQSHRFLKNGTYDPPLFSQIVKNDGEVFFDTMAIDPYFFTERNKELRDRYGYSVIWAYNEGITEEAARAIRYQAEVDYLKIMATETKGRVNKFFWVSQGADDRTGVAVMSLEEFKIAYFEFLKAKDELKKLNVDPIGYVLWAFDSSYASLETLRRGNNSLKLAREWELEYQGFSFLPFTNVQEACTWTGSLPVGSQGRIITYSNTGTTNSGSYIYADVEGMIPLPAGTYKVDDGFNIINVGTDETGIRGKILSKSRCGDAPTPTPTPTPSITPTNTPTVTPTPSTTPPAPIVKSLIATANSDGTICVDEVSYTINLEPGKETLCESNYLTDELLSIILPPLTTVYFKDKQTFDYIKTTLVTIPSTGQKIFQRDTEYGCRNCNSPTPTPTPTPTQLLTPTPTPTGSPTPTPTREPSLSTPPRVFNNGIHVITVQPDNKILVGGTFTTFGTGGNAVSRNRIARLNSIGNLDTTFNTGTGFTSNVVSVTPQVNDIKVQSDGKIIVGGAFSSYSGTPVTGLVRLNSDGTIEQPQFISPGVDRFGDVRTIYIQPDGNVIIGGSFESYNNQPVNNLTRLISTLGAVDNTFNPGFTVNGAVNTIYGDQDGVLVGGGFTGGVRKIGDSSFNDNLETGFDGIVHKIIRQPDGKYLVAGNFIFFNPGANNPDNTYQKLRIARLNSDGTLDSTFGFTDPTKGFNDTVLDIGLQNDGKIIAVGRFINVDPGTNAGIKFYIARLNTNGTVDDTFAGGFNAWGRCINGRLVGGDFTTFGGINVGNIVQLLDNGSQTSPVIPPTPTPTPTIPVTPSPTATPTPSPTPNLDPDRCITYIIQADNGTDVKDPNPYEFFYTGCGSTVQESFTLRNKQRIILCAKIDSIVVSEEAQGVIGVIPDTDCYFSEETEPLNIEALISDYTNNSCYEYKNLFTKTSGYINNSDTEYFDIEYCQTGSTSIWGHKPTFRELGEEDVIFNDSNCSQPIGAGSYSDGTFVLHRFENLKNYFYFCGTNRGNTRLLFWPQTHINGLPIYGQSTTVNNVRIPYTSLQTACDGFGSPLINVSGLNPTAKIYTLSDKFRFNSGTGTILDDTSQIVVYAGTIIYAPYTIQPGYYRLPNAFTQPAKEKTAIIYLEPVTGVKFLYRVVSYTPCVTAPLTPNSGFPPIPTLDPKLIPGIRTLYQGFTLRQS
jgi:uncharacterized delta-60 repeat protein